MRQTRTLTIEDVDELKRLRQAAAIAWPDVAPMLTYHHAVTAKAAELIEAAGDAFTFAQHDNHGRPVAENYVAEWSPPPSAWDVAQSRIDNDDVPELCQRYVEKFGVELHAAVAHFVHIAEPLPLTDFHQRPTPAQRLWLRQQLNAQLPRAGDIWKFDDATLRYVEHVTELGTVQYAMMPRGPQNVTPLDDWHAQAVELVERKE